MSERFLGRRLNSDTLMWEHDDKSGVAFSEEVRQEILTINEKSTWLALERKWQYEADFRARENPINLKIP